MNKLAGATEAGAKKEVIADWVGKNGLVNTIYNVGKIKETATEGDYRSYETNSKPVSQGGSSNTNVPQNALGVNTQSMQNEKSREQIRVESHTLIVRLRRAAPRAVRHGRNSE
jgi:hypothetical protein